MELRYQIYVSSTFRDLKDERRAILNAILELGHFPAGMEVFPAASATPWELIEKIIADSDYYVLIIGGCYGSTDQEGVSYTEREYDLARELQIPTLVFLVEDPTTIPGGKVEMDLTAQDRLSTFRDKVRQHHCEFWNSAEDLQTKVRLGLVNEIRVRPRIGWIRGNRGDTNETLQKLNSLLEQNAALTAELDQYKRSRTIETSEELYAHGDEESLITYWVSGSLKQSCLSREQIFHLLAPSMMSKCPEFELIHRLLANLDQSLLRARIDRETCFQYVDEKDWRTIILQFLALGYWEEAECSISFEGTASRALIAEIETETVTGYKLTSLGFRRYAEKSAVRK